MKKSIIGIAAVLVVWSGLAFGNEKEGKEGVEVELGIKGWYNKLTVKGPEITERFDPALLLGPSVEVKLPVHVFFEASYLVSLTDYEFSISGSTVKADRRDLELAAGYQIIPQLAVYAGYKSAKSVFSTFLSDTTSKLYGGLIGLRGAIPMNETFSVYANAAYLRTNSNVSDAETSEKEKAPGYDVELGVKMEFAKHVSGNLGFRRESTKGKVSDSEERFCGITFGGIYTFE